MIVKGIIFDVNGTLSDINTNEWHDDVYRVVSNLLSYQGISLDPNVVKELYFRIMKEQRAATGERHPEFDVVGIFREIVKQNSTEFTRGLPDKKLEQLPRLLAEAHRAASRFRLQLYSGVDETLRQLHPHYHLAVVTDAQSAYAIPELNAVGLSGYFDPIIISGDFGYRKPDRRLFEAALDAMKMQASEVLFVGNDMYRDVYGAQKVGMKTVFFKSNQGTQEKEGVTPDYSINKFPELLNAIRFFQDL
ncbi:MAG: HAD family hydrolase [Sulfuritalea sp.]|jgi:putative hydrolase of the HAD superfamily|nr:HAD family hydrolase [Sulfuritalea sp.]